MNGVVVIVGPLLRLFASLAGLDSRPELIAPVLGKSPFLGVALVMAGLLMRTLGRREAFLTPGDLRAPSGIRVPSRGRPISWGVVAPSLRCRLGVLFLAVTWTESGFGGADTARVLRFAPFVLIPALFYAFSEEVEFRAGPLATLHRAVGGARRCS